MFPDQRTDPPCPWVVNSPHSSFLAEIGIKRKENKGLSNEAKKVAAAFDDSDDKIKQIIKNILEI